MPTISGDPDAVLADLIAKGLVPTGIATVVLPPTATPPGPKRPAKKPSGQEVETEASARVLVEVDVAVKLVSEANIRGKARAQIARKLGVKSAVREALDRATPPPLPVVVTITRHGRSEMDDDNLKIAAKAVRDVVAEWLGLPSDKDRRVKWRVRQRPAWVPMVTIRVEHRGA